MPFCSHSANNTPIYICFIQQFSNLDFSYTPASSHYIFFFEIYECSLYDSPNLRRLYNAADKCIHDSCIDEASGADQLSVRPVHTVLYTCIYIIVCFVGHLHILSNFNLFIYLFIPLFRPHGLCSGNQSTTGLYSVLLPYERKVGCSSLWFYAPL